MQTANQRSMGIRSFSPRRNGLDLTGKPRIEILVVHPRSDPSDDPIATIWLERIYDEDRLPVAEGDNRSLDLNFQRITAGMNGAIPAKGYNVGFFSATYNPVLNSISLTRRALFLDLNEMEGHRIGTYLMDQIVEWAQQWPDADIEPIGLNVNQATPDNKERRNRFYERYGIEFDYTDESKSSGRSLPMKARDLRKVGSWRANIKVKSPLSLAVENVNDLRSAHLRISFLQQRLNARLLSVKTLRRTVVRLSLCLAGFVIGFCILLRYSIA